MGKLTKREKFAMAAMQGLIAAGDERVYVDTIDEAITYADVMIVRLHQRAAPVIVDDRNADYGGE